MKNKKTKTKKPSAKLPQTYKTYKEVDLVLSMLRLPKRCPVKITITEEYVILQVGPRDWEWDKKTGEFIGAGTSLG